MKVIPFEYASIGRAARFFNCEVGDFFHWHEAGLIKIALDFDDYHGTLLSINEQTFELHPEWCGIYELDDGDINYRDCLSAFVCESIRHDSLSNVGRIHGVATGAWIPNDEVIKQLRLYGNLKSDFSAWPYLSGGEYRVMIKIDAHTPSIGYDLDDLRTRFSPNICADDLRIYKDDLLKVSAILSGEDVVGVPDSNKKTGGTEVREHTSQFSVICQLLKMVGLTNDEIYTNPPAQLQRALEKKACEQNITFPNIDKNTWARWRDRFPKK